MSPEQAVASHPSVEERTERGRATRKEVPRSAHAEWAPAADRRDPVDLLEEQAATRVPELVPDPLRADARFPVHVLPRRGLPDGRRPRRPAAHRTSRRSSAATRTSRTSAPSPRPIATLVFDLNDFDETLPGPFEWDLKRLAASFAIAGRDRGFPKKAARSVNLEVGRSYREAMRGHAAERNLDVWYSRVHVDGHPRAGGRDRDQGCSANVASRRTSPRRVERQPAGPSRS